MRFTVEGVGRIKHAEILLDGITVIAGENNTGKSSIGKALFAHVDSVCGFSRRIRREYSDSLARILFFHAIQEYRDIIGFVHDLIDEMIDVLPGKELTPSVLGRWLRHLVDDGGMTADNYDAERVESYLKWLSGRSQQAVAARKRICELFTQGHDVWADVFRSTALNALFNRQPESLLPDVPNLSMNLECDGHPVGDGELDAMFLDDVKTFPSLISAIDENDSDLRDGRVGFVTEENRIIAATHRDHNPRQEDRKRLLAMLDDIYAGTVERQTGKTSILHETFKTTGELRISSSSMGIRPILLMKELIARQIADDRLILILDEPEVHLHPAWQIAYAQVLTSLSERLGTRILVTTHSPYFLKALLVNSSQEIHCYGTISDSDGQVSLELLDEEGREDRYESMIVPFDELSAIELRRSL